PIHMFDSTGKNPLAAGTALASVTDLVIDRFNPGRLLAGLGNVGLAATSGVTGLWLSIDNGSSWRNIVGGDGGIANSTLPQAGKAAVNEVQTITITATGGTFTITFNGATTGTLNWNDTAAAVQTALEGLSSIGTGNVSVSLNSKVYTVTFQNGLGGQNVNQMTTDSSALTGGTATVNTTTQGDPASSGIRAAQYAMVNARRA